MVRGRMVMPDGSVVTGKTPRAWAPQVRLWTNALKHVSGVDLELEVISDEAIEPISKLKRISWAAKTRAFTPTTLMALSIAWLRQGRSCPFALSSCAVAMPSLA